MRPLDFLVISPAKATKDDKSTKDDKAAKDPGYGRGCRRTRIVKGEEADKKKKVAQADAALKRKEKAEAKKEAAEDKKKEAEAKKKEAAAKKKVAEAKKKAAELKKKQEAELKKKNKAGSKYKKVTPPRDGVTRCNVQPDVEDSSLADIIDQVVAEQNEFAPESDVDNSELVRSAIIKEFPGEKMFG
ncbi:axoneme-associated protein mst101(3)-like [Brassica napus]|uniref:axoneme-associated protein mst101(3)-like n=1 Tax=Brassica napus TaxID=3708 RepID=UPI0006AB154C|nr:axoneme-associated protein mst101(3)-like [Brassica napus]